MRRFAVIIGTRPEAVKMAPVVRELELRAPGSVLVCLTGQHRDMVDPILDLFDIRSSHDLDIMSPDQNLAGLTSRAVVAVDGFLAAEMPDAVLVQGDTTSVMASALASFYRGIPFGHVEAGLRTGDLKRPFPEEANRRLATLFAAMHFAPTEAAADNLRREGIEDQRIFVTGNTAIDALQLVSSVGAALPPLNPAKRLILLTAHRRENLGAPLEEIFRAARFIVETNPDTELLYPLHPNPNVGEAARRLLGSQPRITLCPPLDYRSFVAAMRRSFMIFSDSGGVQEEAPALGIPLLVLREVTERPEGVAFGVSRLVGTRFETIVAAAQKLLDEAGGGRRKAKGVSLHGEGHAADKIAEAIAIFLGRSPSRPTLLTGRSK